MPNSALRSHVVELEGDTGMSRMYKEDLAIGEKRSVEERSVVKNLGQDEVRRGQNEKKNVSTELEKSACEVYVTEQASAEVPSINPVTMPSSSLSLVSHRTLAVQPLTCRYTD
jgi:hypothetical protein